jgi:hypothetical protein
VIIIVKVGVSTNVNSLNRMVGGDIPNKAIIVIKRDLTLASVAVILTGNFAVHSLLAI